MNEDSTGQNLCAEELVSEQLIEAPMLSEPPSERFSAMSDDPVDLEPTESKMLTEEISDDALESSAGMAGAPQGLPCTGPPFLAATFGASPC